MKRKDCPTEKCPYRTELEYYVNKNLEEGEKWKLIFSLTRKAGVFPCAEEYFAEFVKDATHILPVSDISIVIYKNNFNNLVFSNRSGEESQFLNEVIFKNYRYYDALDELEGMLKYNFLLLPVTKAENDLGYIFFSFNNVESAGISTAFAQVVCEHIGYVAQQMHLHRALEKEIMQGVHSFAEFSHELKTPLNAIIGYSDLLKEDLHKFGNETSEQILNINACSKQLKSLMMDIIENAKIRHGRASIRVEEFCTKTAILGVLEVFASKIKEKEICIETILMDMSICSDLTKFDQVLYNLVSNSVKFSPKDGKISVITWADNENFYFEINNEGCEIPEAQMCNMFKFLAESNSSTKNNKEGSGIGLSICKKVVEMQGGKIGVTSTPEGVTTFSFQLPLNL